jgi:hypothetical protein
MIYIFQNTESSQRLNWLTQIFVKCTLFLFCHMTVLVYYVIKSVKFTTKISLNFSSHGNSYVRVTMHSSLSGTSEAFSTWHNRKCLLRKLHAEVNAISPVTTKSEFQQWLSRRVSMIELAWQILLLHFKWCLKSFTVTQNMIWISVLTRRISFAALNTRTECPSTYS